MFQTIIVGYDRSTQAQDALTLAAALASEESELVLCCAHPYQPIAAAVVAGEHDIPGRRVAEERLDAARDRLGGGEHVRTIAVAATSAAAGLHAIAEEEDADLLVVGSSHRGAIGRVLLGSTTAQVLTAPSCPVAVAPVGLHEEALRIGRVTVAYDAGAESCAALATAAELARERRARLRVLTVVEPINQSFGWPGAYVYPEYREDALAIAREQLDEATRELDGELSVTTQIAEGSAAQELVLASSQTDLLVLGSRGYGPLRRVLLGSVSARVAASAASSVLVVPRPAEA